MAKYELSKEWIKKNGEKIKEAYNSTGARWLNVASKEDVLRLLKIINPANATEENAKIFSMYIDRFWLTFTEKLEVNLQRRGNDLAYISLQRETEGVSAATYLGQVS